MADALKLAELVPPETLDRLQREFRTLVGVPIVFTDADGQALTEVEEPLRYCGSLVYCRNAQTLCLRREKWDVAEEKLEAEMRKGHERGEPLAHQCAGGFKDMAVPIIVAGQAVGLAVFARTLVEPPDTNRFRDLARRHGMPAEVGEEVARQALVMPEERVAAVAGFLQTIANLVASAAYDSLRARQVLELEDLRDSLVHMIVHDLRTPLTSIMGSLQVIQEAEYDASLVEELVPIAVASAESMLEMINTLLDISKMENGELELDLRAVRFEEIAAKALDQVKGLALEHGHDLVNEVPPDGLTVQADEDLLRRVVVNLLGNAIKFTPDGGRITLSAKVDTQGLTFSVVDNGPGIPPEDQARIFDKFGQAAAHRDRRKYSTGLGLAFCKMVVEAHGGRIWVESEVGKGSAFHVFIPVRPPGNR